LSGWRAKKKKYFWRITILTEYKIMKYWFPVILGLFILLAFYLLWLHYYFQLPNSSTFNNILTPIVTTAAALIYFITLLVLKKQNEIHISIKQFDFYEKRIESLKKDLLDFSFYQYDGKIEIEEGLKTLIDRADGINYYAVPMTIIGMIRNNRHYKDYCATPPSNATPSEIQELVYYLRSNFFGQVIGNNFMIDRLFSEIRTSKSLIEEHRSNCLNKIIDEVWNHYIRICRELEMDEKRQENERRANIRIWKRSHSYEFEMDDLFFVGFDDFYKKIKSLLQQG
jgi:hypothetical protein